MTTAIVTDSNVSLPANLLEGLPISIVPLEIHHGTQIYKDGVDITPAEFYELQRTAKIQPTTSAPQPGAFVEAFTRAAGTADHIICLTLSSQLSATHSAAITARDAVSGSLGDVRIEVVDSLSAGTAQGLLALAAARMAKDGANTEALLMNIGRWQSSVHLYGYLNSLYYIWRGGRVPRSVMWMGKLLDVKPVLQLSGGKIGMVERPRTERRAMNRIVALATRAAAGGRTQVAVMHAAAPEQAEVLAQRLKSVLTPEELFITEFTPVIGAHTGPGLVGCSVLRLGPPA
jgi:DegV family protein with EDD domain